MLCSCSGNSDSRSSHSETIRPVKSIVAAPANYIEREFVALSTATDAIDLTFKVAGQILSIPVATGDLVAKGEIVALMDRREFELQLSADRANYEQSLSRLDRARRLIKHEAISQQEMESAQSEYTRAESAYENTRENLLETSLRAPFAAIVERVYVDTYQRVQSGERVLRLVTPTTNQAAFTLPEIAIDDIRNPESSYSIHFDNIPNIDFVATVKEYAQTSSDASGFPVTLLFTNPDPERYRISPGMSCVITMTTPQSESSAVIVPLSSIYAPITGGTYVWIIGANNRVERRNVTIDAPIGRSSVIISDGVTSGERIVTAGIYQLSENQHVKIIR